MAACLEYDHHCMLLHIQVHTLKIRGGVYEQAANRTVSCTPKRSIYSVRYSDIAENKPRRFGSDGEAIRDGASAVAQASRATKCPSVLVCLSCFARENLPAYREYHDHDSLRWRLQTCCDILCSFSRITSMVPCLGCRARRRNMARTRLLAWLCYPKLQG